MKHPIYIRSAACISPQQSFGRTALQPQFQEELQPELQPAAETIGTRLRCIEPDYKSLLDPKLIRRMSRIIRMGAAAGLACLRQAGVKEPDAIVTGTAYGCLEDTGLFLQSLIEHNEEMLQPAAFIQSTHNTIGAQIALLLQCTRYNNTFVHRGFSFESALLDAILLLAEGEADNVLAGGVDEITDTSHALLSRFGMYRRRPVSNLNLFSPRSKGTIAGEGAAFFLLAGRRSDHDLARLDAHHTFYKPAAAGGVQNELTAFMRKGGLAPEKIDLIITGDNGDLRSDKVYEEVRGGLFFGRPWMTYKEYCGEYPTSAAFALWFATEQVRRGAGRVLVYNHYLGVHHSAYLLSRV